ncbi:response regulator transcription factor [Baekduia soli]|uniref:Response regulator transcription factor n=1 Tax=Baekduia soli TaxID=496014 RepID=A0A5B8UAL0_9ACTN|nr:response regulator transcription factor [Baekduia soli]QEC50100.1 response regulator transcription factor [Baekduia soli]
MKRLLVVADHSLVVHAIRLALRQTAGFKVVGFVDGRQSISRHLLDAQPDIVLVDDMHVRRHALDRLQEVAELAPEAKSLLLSGQMDEESLDEVFEAGATAVLSKAVHPVALGTLLREVVQENVVHRPRRARASAAAQDCPLTTRELEILRLAAQGHTNGRIARQLWVTEQTVKFHLSNTYRKLGVANRTEASRYAHLHDLVAEPDERLAS